MMIVSIRFKRADANTEAAIGERLNGEWNLKRFGIGKK